MLSEIINQLFDEVCEFRSFLNNESDTGCALMAAAYLDAELAKLLRAILVDDSMLLDKIFSHSGSLGTFSSRIDFAYMLGLIGKKAHRDLHLIRKIRNDFGHSSRPLYFTDAPMVSRCSELYHRTRAENCSPRSIFTNVTLGVLAAIHAEMLKAERKTARKDLEITDETREKTSALAKRLMEVAENAEDEID